MKLNLARGSNAPQVFACCESLDRSRSADMILLPRLYSEPEALNSRTKVEPAEVWRQDALSTLRR
jgi:hypothetical protein